MAQRCLLSLALLSLASAEPECIVLLSGLGAIGTLAAAAAGQMTISESAVEEGRVFSEKGRFENRGISDLK